MSGFRLIDIVKPILPILPEVELPFEKLPFDDKIVYTIFAGLIYLLHNSHLLVCPKLPHLMLMTPFIF